MKGKIFLAPFGKRGTTEFLFQQALTNFPDFSSLLYIAPTPRKVREAKVIFSSAIKTQGPDSTIAFIPPKFLTIKQLSQELYNNFGTKRLLPDSLKPVLFSFLFPDVTLGYAWSIGNLIKDFKQHLPLKIRTGLRDSFSKDSNIGDDVLRRLLDVLEKIERYEIELQRQNLCDSEDLLGTTAEYIKDSRISFQCLILDGFLDLTYLEERIIESLINNSEKVFALVYFDSKNPEGYKISLDFLSFLEKTGFFEKAEIEESGEKLFPASCFPPEIYAFPSQEEEVEGIAKNIKQKFISEKDKQFLSQTIVVFPQLKSYAPIVKRVFEKYQIEHTIYPDKSLNASLVVISVLELLKALDTDFSRLPTVAVLTSPYFGKISPETKEFIAFYSRRAGIIKGADDWKNLTRIIEMRANDELSKKERRRLNKIQRDINYFISVCESLKKPTNRLQSYIQDLRNLLKKLNFFTNIETGPGPVNENKRRIDEELLEEKKEFFDLIDRLKDLAANFKKRDFTFSEFVKIIEYLAEITQLQPEPEEKGVKVLGVLETRGLECEALYFGGLQDGEFPSRLKEDPILPDWLRKKLGLLDAERHHQWQKLHFYRLVNTPQEKPFLSYHNAEEDHLLLPSPFIETEPKKAPEPDWLFSLEEAEWQEGIGENVRFVSFNEVIDFSNDQAVLKLINKKFGPKNYLSVTGLERYKNCPYSFYLERVLGFEILDEPSYEVSSQLWGELVHQVLERLYQAGPLEIQDIRLELFYKILDGILVNKRLPVFWIEVLKRIFKKILPEFLEQETELRLKGFLPKTVETKFRGEVSKGIRIKGRLDRIDENDGQLIILDYKTGTVNIKAKDVLINGTHIQLPLYAKLLAEREKSQIVGLGLYSLSDVKINWLALDRATVEKMINATLVHTQNILQGIRSGIFKPLPSDDNNCYRCPYKVHCPKTSL